MAQFPVRNLEDDTKQRLQRRAAAHGVSMEEEVRRILRSAVRTGADAQPAALGSRIAARFANVGLEGELPELRGEEAQAARFAKR